MPTKNKRINLTVPPDLYERIQLFKERNCILSDTSACIALIQAQLKQQEEQAEMLRLFQSLTPEQIRQVTMLGAEEIKRRTDQGDTLADILQGE